MRDGDAATSRREREGEAQRPLQTLLLASLVVVLGPRGLRLLQQKATSRVASQPSHVTEKPYRTSPQRW